MSTPSVRMCEKDIFTVLTDTHCFTRRDTTSVFVSPKVRKRAKIRKEHNQAPHLTQDTKGIVTTSPLYITNESQEVRPFPAGGHKATINRRARKHSKNNTEITLIINKTTISKTILLVGLNRFHGALTSPLVKMWIKTHGCFVCMKDP